MFNTQTRMWLVAKRSSRGSIVFPCVCGFSLFLLSESPTIHTLKVSFAVQLYLREASRHICITRMQFLWVEANALKEDIIER